MFPLVDRLLKDICLLPWSESTEFEDMIGITDPAISSLDADENFHGGTAPADYPSTGLLYSPEPRLPEMSANDMLDGSYSDGTTHQISNDPSASSIIRHEPRESELMKLLKKSKASTEGAAKPVTYLPAIQPLLPEPSQAVVLPTTTQTVPIQPHALPIQTQKLVISPQPQAVQICPIYPRPTEENRNPQALLRIPG